LHGALAVDLGSAVVVYRPAAGVGHVHIELDQFSDEHYFVTVVEAGELSQDWTLRIPALLRCNSLGVGFPISQADNEEAIDGRVVVGARGGHHGGVCAVRVDMGRDYQQTILV
jgi:hypothetical protein